MAKLAIQYRKASDLIPYAKNARTHSEAHVAQIAASIKHWGWTNPILVDGENGVIAGHGRLMAALKLKMVEVPVLELSGLSDRDKRAYILADNKLALNAAWDTSMLALELAELGEAGADLQLTGFTEDEIAALMADKTEGLTDPDEVPPEPAVPICAPGDLWALGKHRLLCGDSTSADDVAKLVSGLQCDLCFTSPPYAQQRDYEGATKIAVSEWDALMAGVFSLLPVKDGAQILVNLGLVHRDGEWVPYWSAWLEFMRAAEWRRFGWYIWDQGPGLPGDWNGRLAPAFEFIFHFNRETRRANKIIPSKMAGVISNGGLRAKDGSVSGRTKGPSLIQSTKIPDSVIRVTRHKGGLGKAGKHPAVFPVGLPELIITAYSKAGDSLFDPFLGSGTTLIAAEMTGRHCYGLEIAPNYCDVIIQRWQNFTGKEATLDGKTYAQLAAERKAA